ncbi:hypothetical protein J6TS2_50460 [Heyndrickxia sporothermodurans]|nr:hypothetical protein J6TS2_50460 [Heyndrickxia sporothermodurans]
MNNNNIASIRKSKKITQSELAKKLNINRSYLSEIENGKAKPSVRMLERIAAELGVSVKDFF